MLVYSGSTDYRVVGVVDAGLILKAWYDWYPLMTELLGINVRIDVLLSAALDELLHVFVVLLVVCWNKIRLHIL